MMKKAWKKMAALALTLCMGLALLPQMALAAPVTTIDVTPLTGNLGATDNDNGNTWHYVPGADHLEIYKSGITLTGSNNKLQVFVKPPANNITLTLNGATISSLRKDDGDLTVTLPAGTTSSLSGNHTGILLINGKLTLMGGGVLNITSNECGINAANGLTITEGTNVNVTTLSADVSFGTAVAAGGPLEVGANSVLTARGGKNTNGARKGGSGIVVLSVLNHGTITTEAGNGDTTDGGNGLHVVFDITNTGSITTTGGASNTGTGGNGIHAGGNITNSGTLTSTGGNSTKGAGGKGIYAGGTITNTGTLTVIDGTGITPGSGADFTMDFLPLTFTDPTGVMVSGDGIANISRLIVQPNKLHAKGSCKACDAIRGRSPLVAFDIALTQGHSGSVDVFIPLSGSGGNYTVLHCNKGVLEEQAAPYANGGVTTTWKKLSPFAVVQGVNVSVPESTVVDPPKTGEASGYGMVGTGFVLCALGLSAVVRKKRRSTDC